MRVKVSLMGDVCLPRPGCMTIHDGIAPPPPSYPPGSPLPCFESPTPMMWPPGLVLQQNKLTTTVFHKAQLIILGGHDCGAMIPHLTIPPVNLKLGLIIAFSKRKVIFASSTVKANGDSIGCTDIYSSPIPLPMECCAWPVPLPNGFPAFNSLNTVSVGLRLGDILAGFIAIAADIVGAALVKHLRLEGGFTGLAAKLLGTATVEGWGLKTALGLLVGCARIALTQDGKLKVEIGSAYAGVEASIEYRREGRFALNANARALDIQLGHTDVVNSPATATTTSRPGSSSSPGSWGMSL